MKILHFQSKKELFSMALLGVQTYSEKNGML